MNSPRTVLASSAANPRPGGMPRRASNVIAQEEAEVLAAFKRTLLVAALETPPRFRSDLDLVMIRQYLATLGVFTSVAPPILHYVATECTIRRVPDGEVLFYQEDAIDDTSLAHIVFEGSLCGYFNKAFHQRKSKGDDFRTWNSKKTNARGVSIDFGDLQVTYSKGAICGLEDFRLSVSPPVNRKGHRERTHWRHRSVHSQETTIIIGLPKDTLDRASERFGLAFEKGVLTSTKTVLSDVDHLAIFSLLSATTARSVLQGAQTLELGLGEILFAPESTTGHFTNSEGFAYVRRGRLDIYCVDLGDVRNSIDSSADNGEGVITATDIASSTDGAILKEPFASLTKGQTFGDQMIGLGHPHIWVSNPRRRNPFNLSFQVVSAEDSTEVLWITRDQVEQHVRDDQLRLSYNPIFASPCPIDTVAALLSAIQSRDICRIARQLLADAALSKFFFQFPPLVLERLCYRMEVQHIQMSRVLLDAGDTIRHVLVVVCGALHSRRSESSDDSPAKNTLVRQGSTKRLLLSQDVYFIPGDAFGARELLQRSTTCEAPVIAVAGTTMLCIPKPAFERWIAPLRHNVIVKAGSLLQPLLSSPASTPRVPYMNMYASLTKVNRRQSGPSAFSAMPTSSTTESDKKMRVLDEAAILLKRLDLFRTIPLFLLAQMLAHANLLTKPAGELLFREGNSDQSLVVILSGFVSFYSLEHMAATVDMFQKHSFCIYRPFIGSTTNPDDYLAEPRGDEVVEAEISAVLKHCGAMYGVHIQTLPSRNAFRTGVLQEGSVCPATVVAQTDCEYLVFDESVYSKMLAEHTPAVDLSRYGDSATAPETEAQTIANNSLSTKEKRVSPPTNLLVGKDALSGAVPPSLLAQLEAARIPWLPSTSAKKTLILRSMQHMILAPGQRLLQHNETMKHLIFVVSGKLAVYVRESSEVTSVLHASQRSVQSAALERSVASNFSTTSQQLYQESTNAPSTRSAIRRKIAQISETEETLENGSSSSSHSPRGRSTFTNFVMQAAREVKAREANKSDNIQDGTQEKPSATSPKGTKRSLHSMVSKVSLQRKFSAQTTTTGLKETSKTHFLFHLGPGDFYGEEVTALSGVFRSVHDVYADATIPSNSTEKNSSPRYHTTSAGTEILSLDRYTMHAILAKSEEDAANELLGKSATAKAKWQIASKKLFKRASHSTIEEPGGFLKAKKTPKLFDFFKNILNQRRFLTMGTLVQFPELRDLPEDARRELCLNARFEALDRSNDAYKNSGDASGTGLRFFLLLSGHVNLVGNGPNSPVVSQSSGTSGVDCYLREVSAGEGFGEFEILMPESPGQIAAMTAEPTKLLSIPADMFLKHWPLREECRGNIEYLQTCFESLNFERIAYLYHSFSFQTHNRGTVIFQIPEGSEQAKELYLVKEGSCSIRQSITLLSRSEVDPTTGPQTKTWSPSRSVRTPARVSAKSMKLMATIADVAAGHVFWIENGHEPITLVASSASVTIASISIDKLKGIVPRGSLSGLEELSEQLRDLYTKQLNLAKRAAATVMNEKLLAQLPASTTAERLPALTSRVPQNHETYYGGGDDGAFRLIEENALRTARLNNTYNAQHQIERYEAPDVFPVSTLTGSFREQNEYFPIEPSTSASSNQPKQDEFSVPEEVAPTRQTHAPRHVHLDIKVPFVGSAAKTDKTSVSLSFNETKRMENSSRKNIDDGIVVSEREGTMLYEIDVRSRVHAQLCAITSPMRTMRLEPSGTAVNSLGKYYGAIVSPFTISENAFKQKSIQPWPATTAKAIRMKSMPMKKVRPIRRPMREPIAAHQGLTRKQGFLTALRIRDTLPLDGDDRVWLDGILPRVHQGRRFYFALVDCELRQYADTVSLNKLAQAPVLHCYNLHKSDQPCVVSDIAVVPGEAEALLRQSFLLTLDSSNQFLLTAPSAIDKQKWITEMNQARALGGLQNSVSIKVQAPPPIAPARPPADPAVLAAAVIDAFKGRRRSSLSTERRRSSALAPPRDETLHVEFRIS